MPGVKLTPKQEGEYQEAFIIYDSDANGMVNKEQAMMVMRSIGLSPTNEEFNNMLHAKEFSKKDLLTIIASKAPPIETHDELKEALSIFDKHGAGYIEVGELRHVLRNLGEKLNDEEIDAIFRELDISGDNQVCYDDMVQVIQRVYH